MAGFDLNHIRVRPQSYGALNTMAPLNRDRVEFDPLNAMQQGNKLKAQEQSLQINEMRMAEAEKKNALLEQQQQVQGQFSDRFAQVKDYNQFRGVMLDYYRATGQFDKMGEYLKEEKSPELDPVKISGEVRQWYGAMAKVNDPRARQAMWMSIPEEIRSGLPAPESPHGQALMRMVDKPEGTESKFFTDAAGNVTQIVTDKQGNILKQNKLGGVGKPASGMRIEQGPDGKLIITQGAGVQNQVPEGNQSLQKPVHKDIQQKIIKTDAMFADAAAIATDYASSKLTYWGKAKGAALAVADKAAIPIGKEYEEYLRSRKRLVAGTEQLFNAYRKEITGAAASNQEIERLRKAFLNEDLSPAQFQGMYNQYITALMRGRRIARTLLEKGLRVEQKEYANQFDELWNSGVFGDDQNINWLTLFKNMNDQNSEAYKVDQKTGKAYAHDGAAWFEVKP